MPASRLTETVRITDSKIVVSYSDDDLCLTPEMEAKLRAYWTERLDRITAAVLGAPYVPAREQEPEKPRF